MSLKPLFLFACTVCALPLPDAGISPDSLRWADDERLVIDDGEYDPTRVWLYTLKYKRRRTAKAIRHNRVVG